MLVCTVDPNVNKTGTWEQNNPLFHDGVSRRWYHMAHTGTLEHLQWIYVGRAGRGWSLCTLAAPKTRTNKLNKSFSIWQLLAHVMALHRDDCVCVTYPELTVCCWYYIQHWMTVKEKTQMYHWIKGHDEVHDGVAHMSATAIPVRRAVEDDKALIEWAWILSGVGVTATYSMPVW